MASASNLGSICRLKAWLLARVTPADVVCYSSRCSPPIQTSVERVRETVCNFVYPGNAGVTETSVINVGKTIDIEYLKLVRPRWHLWPFFCVARPLSIHHTLLRGLSSGTTMRDAICDCASSSLFVCRISRTTSATVRCTSFTRGRRNTEHFSRRTKSGSSTSRFVIDRAANQL